MHTTVATRSACYHTSLGISTERPTQFVDLTDRLTSLVGASGISTGMLNVQSLHTTTAVVVNELEPLLLDDFSGLFERIAPLPAAYRHDDIGLRTVNVFPGERANGHSHCRALLLPTSVCLNIVHGRLQLGRWQHVFFVELDGPRERQLSFVLCGETAPAFSGRESHDTLCLPTTG